LILDLQLDLDSAKVDHLAKHLGQESASSKVIIRKQSHTHRHIRSDCSTWTTKVVGKYANDVPELSAVIYQGC